MTPTTDLPYLGSDNLQTMSRAIRYNGFLRRLVREGAPLLSPSDLVIDFGAGIGTFSDIFESAQQRIVCVEADLEQRKILHRKGFETASLDEIIDESAIYIYSLNVLEHIADDETILRDLAAKLKRGGRLMLYVPAFRMLWTDMDDAVGHFRRYRRRQLAAKVAGAGLRVDCAAYADSAGFFAALAYKMMKSSKDSEGKLSERAVLLFDRLAFPIGRLLDKLVFSRWLGKNVFVVATKVGTSVPTHP